MILPITAPDDEVEIISLLFTPLLILTPLAFAYHYDARCTPLQNTTSRHAPCRILARPALLNKMI